MHGVFKFSVVALVAQMLQRLAEVAQLLQRVAGHASTAGTDVADGGGPGGRGGLGLAEVFGYALGVTQAVPGGGTGEAAASGTTCVRVERPGPGVDMGAHGDRCERPIPSGARAAPMSVGWA